MTIFKNMCENDKTYDVCLAAVARDPYNLVHVPLEYRDARMGLLAVSNCGCVIDQLSEDSLSNEVCLAAVVQNGDALRYVPLRMRTTEICLAAVVSCCYSIKYVKHDKQTLDMCLIAASNAESIGSSVTAYISPVYRFEMIKRYDML